jgi:hypothetical protein
MPARAASKSDDCKNLEGHPQYAPGRHAVHHRHLDKTKGKTNGGDVHHDKELVPALRHGGARGLERAE